MPPLIILAGGRATRLGALSDDLPKFLMPVGEGKCFADLQLEWAKTQEFQKVILSVGWHAQQVQSYCGDGSRWGLSIEYSHDGELPLGTGGAVRKSWLMGAPLVAVTYGDTLLDLPCAEVIELARLNSCDGLMTAYRNDVAGHVCNADFDGPKLLYSKSSPYSEWKFIDYGFLVLKDSFLKLMPTDSAFDLATSLERCSLDGRLLGYESKHRFWEIGSPESLKEFQTRPRK